MSRPSRRPHVLAAMLAFSLMLGCQSPASLEGKSPRVIVSYGSMQLHSDADLGINVDFSALLGTGYKVQAVSGFSKVVAKVTGPNIVGEVTAEVTAFECPEGKATLNFTNLPAGKVTVVVNALDTAGKIMVWAQKDNVDITPGTTQFIEMYCQQANGKLDIVFRCPELCGGTPAPSPSPSLSPSPIPTGTPSPSPTLAPTVPPNEVPFDAALQPVFVDVDRSAGYIWTTTNWEEGRIVMKYTSAGTPVAGYRTRSAGNQSLAVDAGSNVWVASPYSRMVTKLAPSGGELAFIDFGEGFDPYAIAVSPTGDVWVTHVNKLLVSRISSAGVVIGTYPLVGAGGRAVGLTVDTSGNVWVALDNGGVKKVSPAGQILGSYSVPGAQDIAIDASGNAWVASRETPYGDTYTPVYRISTSGTVTKFPAGRGGHGSIDISPTGDIWVNDTQGMNNVTRLSSTGEMLATYPVGNHPYFLDIDASGNAQVTVSQRNTPLRVSP